MKRQYVAIAVYFGFLMAFEARGQLFGVEFVDDIQANGHLIAQLGQMAIQNEKVNQVIDIMLANSSLIPGAVRAGFGGYTQPYYQPQINDIYGETAGWPVFLSGGLPSTLVMNTAMTNTTFPIAPSPLFRSMLGSPALLTLASGEIQDALVRNAFLTSSSVRAQQGLNALVIQNLQSACLNGTGGDNFLENNAQQNCSTAAGILGAQQTQAGDSIAAANLDLAAAAAMDARNTKIAMINQASQELTDDMGREDYTFSSTAIQSSLLGTL
jgi:hypothetical protein